MPKLFGRWVDVGALFPFCRRHSEKGTTDHEPWSFGEECEEVCRLALKRRHRLIPHIYTLFYLAHKKGLPVAAPAFFVDPKDSQLRKNENSFLLGPLLVYARIYQHYIYKADQLSCLVNLILTMIFHCLLPWMKMVNLKVFCLKMTATAMNILISVIS